MNNKTLLFSALAICLPLHANSAPASAPASSIPTDATPSSIVANPDLILKLSRDRFANVVTPAAMASVSSSPKGKALITAIGNDQAWLDGFLGSGPVAHGDVALKFLALICDKDPLAISSPLYRRLATAVALEYARNKWPEEDMLKRYAYFRSSHAQGLLNPVFDTLNFWDMRILGGAKKDGFGHPDSLAWQRDNVKLPAQEYTGCCWQAPYRLHNIFGDSIHGNDYYLPFDNVFGNNTALRARNVGAVCGGLSHYGAFAAIANGIPALTMGEPGHCAYAVRVDSSKWVPAYSLSWQRGCHWNFWNENWHFLILTQDLLSHPKINDSNHAAWLAQHFAASGQRANAISAYKLALEILPFNYPVWTDYIAYRSNGASREDWADMHNGVIQAFASRYPAVCQLITQNTTLPKLLPLCSSPQEKLSALLAFNRAMRDFGPERWNFESQLDFVRKNSIGDSREVLPLIKELVSIHLSSQAYSPIMLAWCQNAISSQPALQNEFLNLVINASKSGGGLKDGDLNRLLGDALVAASNNKDLNNFQSVGKMLAPKFSPSLPKFDPFPGELLSSGGLLRLSSCSSRYGERWQLWGVLESCGGHFHTDNDNDAWAEVTLPKVGQLSGIVLVLTPGSTHRLNDLVVEVSADGSSWQKVADLPKAQRVHRVDLSDRSPVALYVRVTRKGKEFFHLNAIQVFGKRAS